MHNKLKMILLTLLFALVLTIGCSTDENTDDTIQGVVKTVLLTESLTPLGGTLVTNELNISIMPDTLAEETLITITKVHGDGDLYYEIDGLPQVLSKAVGIAFMSAGERETTTQTLLRYVHKGSCFSTTFYAQMDCVSLIEGEVRGEQFIATIPATLVPPALSGRPHALRSSSTNNNIRTVSVNNKYVKFVESEAANIHLYIKKNINTDNLGNQLVFETLTTWNELFSAHGFHMDNVVKPYFVVISDADDYPSLAGASAYIEPNFNNNLDTSMVLHYSAYQSASHSLEEKNNFIKILTHEIFHTAQFTTIAQGTYSDVNWLMEGSSTFIEHVSTEVESNVTETEQDHRNFLVYGLNADYGFGTPLWLPSVDDSIDERFKIGYGMGLFFYYLYTRTDAIDVIFNIWIEGIANDKSTIESIENSLAGYALTLREEWFFFVLFYFDDAQQVNAGWPRMSSNAVFDANSELSFNHEFTMAEYSALYVELKNSDSVTHNLGVNVNNTGLVKIIVLDEKGALIRELDKNRDEIVFVPALKTYKLLFVALSTEEEVRFSIESLEAPEDECQEAPPICPTTGSGSHIIEISDTRHVACEYTSGTLWYESPYLNDLKDGTYKKYSRSNLDQVVVAHQYQNGLSHGYHKYCDSDGHMISCSLFENDRYIGECP